MCCLKFGWLFDAFVMVLIFCNLGCGLFWLVSYFVVVCFDCLIFGFLEGIDFAG